MEPRRQDAGPGSSLPLQLFLTPLLFSSKLEKRSVFLERSSGQYANSDEEDGYESPDVKRRGASVDEFLKGSELGKLVSGAPGSVRGTERCRPG